MLHNFVTLENKIYRVQFNSSLAHYTTHKQNTKIRKCQLLRKWIPCISTLMNRYHWMKIGLYNEASNYHLICYLRTSSYSHLRCMFYVGLIHQDKMSHLIIIQQFWLVDCMNARNITCNPNNARKRGWNLDKTYVRR